VEQMLELPAYLIWIDVSYNEFKTIGQVKNATAAAERVFLFDF